MAENVVIERDDESTVMFTEAATQAYLGYVTIKVIESVYCIVTVLVLHGSYHKSVK